MFATKKKGEIVIPVARVDANKDVAFLEQQNLQTVDLPVVYVYYDGSYYKIWQGNWKQPKKVIHLINRLLHPLVNLKSEEAIEKFLNHNKEHEELTRFMMPKGITLRDDLYLKDLYTNMKYKTRVILFIYNTGDYDEEIEKIRDIARKSAEMLNLRIGLVNDPRLVKKLKKETSWFGDASLNTMILKRYDGEVMNLDLL